jgi:hypothetical protein
VITRFINREKDIDFLESKYVQWNNSERTEYPGIIAKKITQKEELRKSGVIAFDLEDF